MKSAASRNIDSELLLLIPSAPCQRGQVIVDVLEPGGAWWNFFRVLMLHYIIKVFIVAKVKNCKVQDVGSKKYLAPICFPVHMSR